VGHVRAQRPGRALAAVLVDDPLVDDPLVDGPLAGELLAAGRPG
jgi:hypothetical protein